jgi:hypothetical protein
VGAPGRITPHIPVLRPTGIDRFTRTREPIDQIAPSNFVELADHLVRSWLERSTSRLDEIFFVVRSETYETTAAGTSLQMSPLTTTKHYQLPQNSRNHPAFSSGPESGRLSFRQIRE